MSEPLVTMSVNPESVRSFEAALSRYRTELGNSAEVAVRRGCVAFLKSMRARTRKAPQHLASRDITPSATSPVYIHGDDGKLLRRWDFMRYSHGSLVYVSRFVPAHQTVARSKGGKWSVRCDVSAQRREAMARANIRRWGLAKQSWGWLMHALFGGGEEIVNPNATVSRAVVHGTFKKSDSWTAGTGLIPGAKAHLENDLDYIVYAVEPGAINESLTAATNWINETIRRGLAKAELAHGVNQ